MRGVAQFRSSFMGTQPASSFFSSPTLAQKAHLIQEQKLEQLMYFGAYRTLKIANLMSNKLDLLTNIIHPIPSTPPTHKSMFLYLSSLRCDGGSFFSRSHVGKFIDLRSA